MRRPSFGVVLIGVVLSTAACETPRPDPYFLVAPSSIAPSVTSMLTKWDSSKELQVWIENPWTEAPWSALSEPGVEFARIELKTGVSSLLQGPNLEPVFTGLRAVRVRVRFFPAPADPAASLHHVSAFVAWTGRSDPSNPLIPEYFALATGTSQTWQVLELLPERSKSFPPIVDARWMYLTFGRTGAGLVDVDWIELAR